MTLKLSPADITNILGQPELAIDLLKRKKIQRIIINLTIQDQQWWDTSGQAAITKLYQHYRYNPGKDAVDTLELFAARIVYETCTAMLARNNDAWFGLVTLLGIIAPAESKPVYWAKLLEMLSKKAAETPRWMPSREYTWEVRSWFLQQWAYGIQDIPDQQIVPWLEGISLEELRQVLSTNFPSKWKVLAIVALITSPSTSVPPWQ